MPFERPSDVGFCVVDSNADLIANTLVRRVRDGSAELESEINRLYRGRNAYQLSEVAVMDLERAVKRLTYLAETLRDVQRAQREDKYLQAAE
jgi:hypothetical protein